MPNRHTFTPTCTHLTASIAITCTLFFTLCQKFTGEQKPYRRARQGELYHGVVIPQLPVATQPHIPAKPGRKSLYRPEYCQAIIDFFSFSIDAPNRQLEPVITRGEQNGKPFEKQEIRFIPAPLPLLESFAESIGVTRETLGEWADQFPAFSEAHARAKAMQKALLIDRGLTRQYDPSFAIFTAKNITDMKDQIGPAVEVNVQIVAAGTDLPARAPVAPIVDLAILPPRDR